MGRAKFHHLRKGFTTFGAFALVASSIFFSGPARAVVVNPGTLGGFEVDGNFVHTGANLDWDNVTPTIVVDDTRDSGFQGSSKEEQPSDWTCNTGGANPPKGNILRAYANPRITKNSAYLDLGFVRESGLGDTHINFEFDKNPSPPFVDNGACHLNRSVGDFLVTYDYAGGNAAAEIRAWTWNGAHWDELNLTAADAVGASNVTAIADDPVVPGVQPVGSREFGEATINLDAPGIPKGFIGCPGFGELNVRSRSSESITSALQDHLPATAIDLSTCGSIKVQKVDDLGHGLAGATFELWKDNGDGTFDAAKDTLKDTCITALVNNSTAVPATCTFASVVPSPPDYFVREASAPAGYNPDPTVAKVTVGFREDVTVAHVFVNPLVLGALKITKTDALHNLVPGVHFELLQNGLAAHDRSGNVAECTTDAKGTCTVTHLVPGTYTVHEDPASLPSTMLPAPDQTGVVVTGNATASVTFVNPLKPIAIALTKKVNGAKSVTVHQGDALTYDVVVTNTGDLPLTISDLGDVANGTGVTLPASCTAHNGTSLAAGGSFTCTYTSTAPAVDVANVASVKGTDSLGRDVSSSDTALVNVIHPGISIDKLVNGKESVTVHQGDALHYTLKVTNTGGVALDVTSLTDAANGAAVTLPNDCTQHVGQSLASGASFSCAYDATAPAGDVSNTATVQGTDPIGGKVTDDDTALVKVVHPAIAVQKLVNGVDHTTVHNGDPLTYSIKVTNTGDDALTIKSLTDAANGAAVALPASCTGHLNQVLAAGDSFDCSYNATASNNDVTNVVTVTGADGLPGGTVSANDDASVDVIHPAIALTKTVNGQKSVQVHAGDSVTYSVTATNTGDVPLTITGLTDVAGGNAVALPAACTGHVGTTLAAGAAFSCSYPGVATQNDVTNTATVQAVDPLQLPVQADDQAKVDVVHPAITIEKLVNGAESFTGHTGDALTYQLKVTNVGDNALTVDSLKDVANGTAVTLPAGCTAHVGTVLAPAASFTCTYSATAPAGDVDNVATVAGHDGLPGGSVDATDNATVHVVHPAIALTKTVNGKDSVQVHAGDPLTYDLTITNTGDVALTLTSLADVANGGPVALPAVCTGLVGQTMAPGASKSCSYSATAPAGDVNNTATVHGKDGLPGGDVSAHDTALVDVITPDIHLTKVVNGAKSVQVHQNDPLTYTLTVKNTGDTALKITALSDLAGGKSVTLPSSCLSLLGTTLDAGASVSCSYPAKAPADDVTNTATVAGQDILGLVKQDSDSAQVDVVHPQVLLQKLVEGAKSVQAHQGDTVHYTLKVTNTGDIALKVTGLIDVANGSQVTLPADCMNHVGTTLAVGGSFTCSYTATAPADDVDNTATVNATDPLPGGDVSSTDSAHVDVIHPAIQIVKSGPAQAHEGDLVTYSFLVKNTGDVTLHKVTVTDNILGPVGTIDSLDAGASTMLQKQFTVPVGKADIVNTGSACGRDPLTVEVCDTDHHTLHPIHPAIAIDKTADPTSVAGPSGQVTYSYKVTNTGDVTLQPVTVTDDILGPIGTIPQLTPGQSVTLTTRVTVTTSTPPRNVGTAVGTDPLGKKVSAQDDAIISVVLGEQVNRPLPRTGFQLGLLFATALLLLATGAVIRTNLRRDG